MGDNYAIKPKNYNVVIKPNLTEFTFEAEAKISCVVNSGQIDKITLDSNNLTYNKFVISSSDKTYELKDILDNKSGTLTILLNEKLSEGVELEISTGYVGIINDKMAGFYRSKYLNGNNETKYMVSTHFETSDARQVFPCFDQPSLRATFDISLLIPSNLTCISNMDIGSETEVEGLKLVKFNTTPSMPTYLVAFAIGELGFVQQSYHSPKSNTTIPVSVYAPVEQAHLGYFALDITIKVLALFENLFQIEYPLPKLDLLAVPEFNIGAMENWGLMTFRTSLLLYSESQSSNSTKQRIAGIIAHELAHQWFGNLVTIRSWNQLWLKEGFATLLGTYAVDKLFPSWGTWTQFILGDYRKALDLDALPSSHPLQFDADSGDLNLVNQIFDAISYSKGASLIRMFATFLGDEKFFAGLHHYLKKFRFGATTTEDLWLAFQESTGLDIISFMDGWTKRKGYPLIVVTENNDKIIIRQSPYTSTNNNTDDGNRDMWWVPLFVKGITESKILTGVQLELDTKESAQFVKLNFDGKGLFRTLYSATILDRLGDHIQSLTSTSNLNITESDLIQLISDTSALASSGHTSTIQLLNLMIKCKNVNSQLVLEEIGSQILDLGSIWYNLDEKSTTLFNRLKLSIFTPILDRVGYSYQDGEELMMTFLRSLTLKMLVSAKHQPTIDRLLQNFHLAQTNGTPLNPDHLELIYTCVVKYRTDGFETIYNLYTTTQLSDHKLLLLVALCSTPHSENVESLLQKVLSLEFKPQDLVSIFNALSNNFQFRDLIVQFLHQNLNFFVQLLGQNVSTLGNLIKVVCYRLNTPKHLENVESWFSNIEEAKLSVKQTIDLIKSRCEWLKRDGQQVTEWLQHLEG